ncbi:FMN-dependent alpha-hydroxy acid dehydrogenase [Hyaloscypha variabilis F]|uniref:FMN-dependent alpha-hydroxy acid dehydrogenase n=1 Tax=Hyaloscypha variabilis (strain UAMH 11265 / GT02V1 / F) TaxID=1149755 RepID=A0A2J6SBI5_HYAVF|nr:FMN-dependent alpha-hydroxy acid dehydrogenase [Hyaloscypha variabilis F]
MSDPVNPNQEYRTTPQWGLYQRENFWKPNIGEMPLFSTAPEDLERLAEEKLTQGGWYYSSCNAGNSWTHLANRQAFYRHRIIPRQLVDTNTRDTAMEIFGHKIAAPVGFAPIGINRIYHPTGEISVAKVAQELNLVYSLSSAGSYSIEDVGKANGNGPRFFQLYQSHDEELCISMLERAHKSGFDVCMLTTDTWQLAWRHHDVATGNYAFYHQHGAGDIALQDPVFLKRVKEAGLDPKKDPKEVGAKWIDENIWHGKAHSWEKLPWVIEQWKRISGGKPFCLKGIQSVPDAKRAVEMGVDGIVVSNHAGRQVDGAIASLDALEEIVDAVGNKIYIMYDTGIRGASDVFKALAVGAKFVFIGRLWVWALSIGGEAGVRHVVKGLLAEFDILLNVAGYRNVEEINRDAIRSLPNSSSLIAEKARV